MQALLLMLGFVVVIRGEGMLAVQDNEVRSVKDLSGIWRFKVTTRTNKKGVHHNGVPISLLFHPQADLMNVGMKEKWWLRPLEGQLQDMPVPASYNDITQGARFAIGVSLMHT